MVTVAHPQPELRLIARCDIWFISPISFESSVILFDRLCSQPQLMRFTHILKVGEQTYCLSYKPLLHPNPYVIIIYNNTVHLLSSNCSKSFAVFYIQIIRVIFNHWTKILDFFVLEKRTHCNIILGSSYSLQYRTKLTFYSNKYQNTLLPAAEKGSYRISIIVLH